MEAGVKARVPFVIIGKANGEERTISGVKTYDQDVDACSDQFLIDLAVKSHTVWPEGFASDQWGPVERFS
jgi:hypothetical protein